MTITSNSNTNVKASIKIDFNRQFKGFKATDIVMIKEITSFDDLTISKEDLINEIKEQSLGFGDGTRYSSTTEITNLVIKESIEKYTFLNDSMDVINSPSLICFPNFIFADQFIETLSMCYGKPFSELFINSDAENNLMMEPAQGRDEIADFNYLTFYSKTRVDFTFYGENYSFTFESMHVVQTMILTDYLIIPVTSIVVEIPNIVF